MNFPNQVLLSRCRDIFVVLRQAGKFDARIDIGDIVARARKFLPDLWQEARGSILRKRYEGLRSRIDAADIPAKSACFDFIRSKFEPFRRSYANASSTDRKRILKLVATTAHQAFAAGDWPRAFGLAVIMFNLEAGYLPGEDAAVVKAATDVLIDEAYVYPEPQADR